jgi:3-dehydroquinate dehydratase II
MPLIAVVNGPNLNKLGSREPDIYGSVSLEEINEALREQAESQGFQVEFFQSNHEGAIIDYIQALPVRAQGLIINPGALTHYGYSLRDCLASVNIPVIEVHITNIHAREEWRSTSLVSSVVNGVITGLGPRVYNLALQELAVLLQDLKETEQG